MGITIAPTKPTVDAPSGRGPGVCPDCAHEREGIAVTAHYNRRLLARGKELMVPSCSSGFAMGWGDEDMCGCANSCHSERLVTTTRHIN